MDRRRALAAAACLLLGVVVVLSAPYRVWRPTVANPGYWEGHTGGLFPLVLQAAFGGSLVVSGVALGFDTVAKHLRAVGVRTLGVLAIVGGLLGYEPINQTLAGTFGGSGVVYFGVPACALVLLGGSVAGVITCHPSSGRHGRYGAGVLTGGFTLLAGVELLNWGLTTVEPRAGALTYPPLGVALVGTLGLAIGSVLLGASLRGRDDAPRWLGPLLVAAGLLVMPLEVLGYFQYGWASGLYGFVWIVVGAHLLSYTSSSTG